MWEEDFFCFGKKILGNYFCEKSFVAYIEKNLLILKEYFFNIFRVFLAIFGRLKKTFRLI